MHGRMSSSVTSLYLTDAKRSHPLTPSVITKSVSRYCQMSPRGQNHPRLRTSEEEDSLGHQSLLFSCLYLGLDLLSFICSQPHVILLDLKTSFPLIV